jgi:hypothetical protein
MTKRAVAETHLPQAVRPVLRGSSLMRAVNTSMRKLSAGLDENDPIAFFCECEVDGCFAICWMTPTELDARVEHGDGWILSDGHRASEAWSPHSPVIQERPSPLPGSLAPLGARRVLSTAALPTVARAVD